MENRSEERTTVGRVVCSLRGGLDSERPPRLGIKYQGEKQERKDHLATTKAFR